MSQLDAAWLLGTMTDAYLYSNVHVPSGGHFASVLLPVLLAVSEVRQISGPEALTAYVAGYEVAARLASAVGSDRQNVADDRGCRNHGRDGSRRPLAWPVA